MKIFIAGDNYFKPEIVIERFQNILSPYLTEIEFESLKLPYPIETIYLDEQSVIPTGMAWDNNMDENYGKCGVREYYGQEDILDNHVSDVDILIVHGVAVPKTVIQKAEQLKLIGCLRGGPVNIDIDEAKRRKIAVTNTPGKNASGVAEYTIGLILSHLRHIAESSRYFLEGEYKPVYYNYDIAGMELENKKIGLVGFGRIARKLTKILQAFSAEVYVHDPYVDEKDIKECGAVPCGLEDLLSNSDVVSLHARASKNVQPLIGERELSLMKSTALLINTARGMLVDYQALYHALTHNKIQGAALDVFGLENFEFYKRLISLPNVTATPHIAGSSKETVLRGSVMMAEEIKRFIENEPLKYKIV
jgi:D-3-phosphoglycerate dehydrogenase